MNLTARELVVPSATGPQGGPPMPRRGRGWVWAQVATSPPRTPLLPGEKDKGELRVLGTHHYVGHTTDPLKGSFGEKKKNNPQGYFCLGYSSKHCFF